LAFTKLKESGAAAEAVLAKMFESDPNPRFRSRALWLLGQIDGETQKYVDLAVGDKDKDIRIAALRLARRMSLDVTPVIEKLAKDESPQVRRECAIALRHVSSEIKVQLWNVLAKANPARDRWYLEALGIALDGDANSGWDQNLAVLANTSKIGDILSILWRSRGRVAAVMKVGVIATDANKENATLNSTRILQFFRSMDFEDRAIASGYCAKLLTSDFLSKMSDQASKLVVIESLSRLTGADATSAAAKLSLTNALKGSEGTTEFVQLVRRFQSETQYPELLRLSQLHPAEQLGVEAIVALLELKQWDLIGSALRGDDTAASIATADALGNSQNGAISGLLLPVVKNAEVNIDVRRAAVKAASKAGNAAMELVKLVDEKTLDPELEQSVAAALHSSPHRNAREAAQRLFPLPPSKDNMPTPPISELTKLKGDVANGRMVFFSTGTCHKCHVVDGMGREIGPNLTEIGSKLSREAMFESVLYPSAGISHNFELWTVVKTDGTTLNGLLVSNTDAEVSIKGDDALVRAIPKSEVEELVKQKISLMPADLQKTMTTQELADVVEYMQTLKKK
jgi:putative heme-binding domain-containing protein